MTIAAFVADRLDEDEAVARAAAPRRFRAVSTTEQEWLEPQSRALREVAAKRRLLTWAVEHWPGEAGPVSDDAPWVLQVLAAVWADHRDYRAEWADG